MVRARGAEGFATAVTGRWNARFRFIGRHRLVAKEVPTESIYVFLYTKTSNNRFCVYWSDPLQVAYY